MGAKHDILDNRLWAKIEKRSENECWLWLATKNNKGYGMISISAKIGKRLAHRCAFESVNGPIPQGLIVMHSCDNPACCNPSHLSLGTMQSNHADMVAKGRRVMGFDPDNKPPRYIGENHPRAKITENLARLIKSTSGSRKAIIEKYGVSDHIIKSIRSGRTWKHL